ncbi:MAG: hypothetical protein ACYCVD_02460 [Desulfitobacteriaceae bacterium]
MKVLKLLLVADILLILSGFGWVLLGSRLNLQLQAFNRPLSPIYFGLITVLLGLYQSLRIKRAYVRIKSTQ